MKKDTFIFGLVVGLFGGLMSASALTPGTSAQIPYRGHLQQDGVPVTADVGMHFYLYPDDTSTVSVWDEVHSPTQNPGSELVPVSGGAFSVLLGSYVDIEPSMLRQTALYLSVGIINADGSETELVGRQLVGAAPFAWGSAPGENFSIDGNLDCDQCVSATNILNATVGTAELADGSVNSAKIANQSIIGQDIAGGTISQGKLTFNINGDLINANSPQDTGNPDYLSDSSYQPNSPTEFTHHCPRGWVMVGLSGVTGGFMGHARIWCSLLGRWR